MIVSYVSWNDVQAIIQYQKSIKFKNSKIKKSLTNNRYLLKQKILKKVFFSIKTINVKNVKISHSIMLDF